MPTISIVMPVFNVEKYIEKAIESILVQTVDDFELIVVNDGSEDSSMSIVDGFAEKDYRIKIVNQSNKGLSAARNTGLKSAEGDYVCFIDSDDVVAGNFLAITMEAIVSQYPDVLMFGMIVEKVGNKEEIIETSMITMSENNYTRSTIREFKVGDNSLKLIGYSTNKLYKRSLLLKHQILFDEKKIFLEDIDFNERVFKYVDGFMVIKECLYHYKRRNRISLINTFRKEDFDYQMDAVRSRKEILQNWEIEQSIIDSIIAGLHMDAIKGSCANLFMNKNSLSFNKKCEFIKEILENPLTQSRVKCYETSSLVGNLLKIVIQYKKTITLAVISNVFSIKLKIFN